MSSNDSASKCPEFHIMRRKDFETWQTVAVLYDYNTARAVTKFLKEKAKDR